MLLQELENQKQLKFVLLIFFKTANTFVVSKWKRIDFSKVRKLVKTRNNGYVSKGGEFRVGFKKKKIVK